MEATGSRIITYPDKEAEFRIWDIADAHRFAKGMAIDHFRRDVRRIDFDPYSLWAGGGDYCDWIVPGDKRFDPASFDPDVKVVDLTSFAAFCAKMIIEDYWVIRGKCIGFALGNHDLKYLSKNSEMAIHEHICRELGTRNMAYSGWADLYFIHDPEAATVSMVTAEEPPEHFTARLRVLVYHGIGAAGTAGGKLNALKKIVDFVIADLVMTGHLHEQIAKQFQRLFPNETCTAIDSKPTMGLITGSYLRTYAPDFTSYGELKGYFPTALGASFARYIPSTRRLSVEIAADNVGIGPR